MPHAASAPATSAKRRVRSRVMTVRSMSWLHKERHSQGTKREARPQVDPDNCIDGQIGSFAGLGNRAGEIKNHLRRTIAQLVIVHNTSLGLSLRLAGGVGAHEKRKARFKPAVSLVLEIGAGHHDTLMLMLEVERKG